MYSNALITPTKLVLPIIFVTACLIVGTLIGYGNWFLSAEYTGLYLYEFIAVVLIIMSAVKLLLTRKELHFVGVIPIALILYGIYILVHGLWIMKNFNAYHEYLIISYILAICLPILIEKEIITNILKTITIIASIEALICTLQFLKLTPSLNKYFNITGTLGNPNITAMFLAMALCLVPYVVKRSKPASSRIIVLGAVVIVFALILLKCRTAWIGLTSGV